MKEVKNLIDVPMSEDMIVGLEKLFPLRCPSLSQSERDIFFYAGQVKLIEMCRQVLNMQQKENVSDSSGRSHRGRSTADKLAGL